ncbi:MAG: sulfotransferase [Nitrososphaerales archaeon]
MKAHVPEARIIIMLRDPVERAFSNYLMKMKYSGKKVSFYSELIRDYQNKEKVYGVSDLYVELGKYYEQVKRYFDVFGRTRVKVIIFEEFITHEEETVNEVLRFLGVNYAVMKIKEQHNPYSVPRSRMSLWIYAFFRWLRAHNIKF